MNDPATQQDGDTRYELRFNRLFSVGRSFAFRCDAKGHVDIDGLSETGRANFLYARTLIGRDFSHPVTCAVPMTDESAGRSERGDSGRRAHW